MTPLITICIPAYQRPEYLRRLLESIRIQDFRDFEIIITDDSPDDSVYQLSLAFSDLPIQYFQNKPALGTPANWNKGISLAKGKWIKLMHDDDWFASEHALGVFALKAQQTDCPFIFCAYQNQFEKKERIAEIKQFPSTWKKRIIRQPMTLLAYNVIGPPSVILVRADVEELYDEALKWRVDMEFYVRLLTKFQRFEYINQVLVNVGVSESQVTQSCIYNPAVELPEGQRLLMKHGSDTLQHLLVYDAWWRLLRNLEVRDETKLSAFTTATWPPAIQTMVRHLAKYPAGMLKFGPLSKLLMAISYLRNPFKSVS